MGEGAGPPDAVSRTASKPIGSDGGAISDQNRRCGERSTSVTLHRYADRRQVIDQVLPDGHGVAPPAERGHDQLAVGLAGARLRCSTGLVPGRGGGVNRARVGRGCRRRVGGHLRRNGRVCRSSARTAPAPHHHASGLQVGRWPSRAGPRSPARCAAATSRGVPGRGPAVVSLQPRRCSCRAGTRGSRPASTSRGAIPEWPVFRCPLMAAFGCPPRIQRDSGAESQATGADVDVVVVERQPHLGLFGGGRALDRLDLHEVGQPGHVPVEGFVQRSVDVQGLVRRMARMVMRPAASRVKTAGGSGGGGPWMTTDRSAPSAAAAAGRLRGRRLRRRPRQRQRQRQHQPRAGRMPATPVQTATPGREAQRQLPPDPHAAPRVGSYPAHAKRRTGQHRVQSAWDLAAGRCSACRGRFSLRRVGVWSQASFAYRLPRPGRSGAGGGGGRRSRRGLLRCASAASSSTLSRSISASTTPRSRRLCAGFGCGDCELVCR